MNNKDFIKKVYKLIENNDIKSAINELKEVLENSPKLTELILQSSRYNDIMSEIRMGTVEFEDANVTKNQIRLGLLSFIEKLQEENLEVRSEMENAISIVNSKNVVTGSTISAGGSVNIGDQTSTPKDQMKDKPKPNYILYGFLLVILLLVIYKFFIAG